MNFLDIDPTGLYEKAETEFRKRFERRPTPKEIVFMRQRQLMVLYKPIEKDILGRACPIDGADLHSALIQAFLKERAWWATEELIEAQWGVWEENRDKALEELADALHFVTEICILADVDPLYVPGLPRHWPESDQIPLICYPSIFRHFIMAVLEELGIGMWQFRNKAWKQTQTLTDIQIFRKCLQRAHWGLMMTMLHYIYGTETLEDGQSMVPVVTTYLRKSEVNLWRIKTHY